MLLAGAGSPSDLALLFRTRICFPQKPFLATDHQQPLLSPTATQCRNEKSNPYTMSVPVRRPMRSAPAKTKEQTKS